MLHSITVSRAESRHGDTRLQDRYRIVDEFVRMTHCGATYDAQLINVCGSGAMVSADFEPVPWDGVALHLGDHPPVGSAVLWVRVDASGSSSPSQSAWIAPTVNARRRSGR